jgi:oligopeptide transport system substrate-binding protein
MRLAFLELLVIGVSAAAFAACQMVPYALRANSQAERAKASAPHRFEADTLRINIGAEPPSLDWATTTDSTSFDVIANVMVGLTRYKADLSVGPGCAEKWEILDGGRRYLFHLRPNMLWSDGRPVEAYDFEYAWKRLLDPRTAAQYAYFLYDLENAFEFNTNRLKEAGKVGVRALDSHTLEVRLKRPAAYFIYLTAFCPTYPQRRDLIEKWPNSWTEPGHLVGNGPFILSKWEHEYKIELRANPLFVEGKPSLHKLKMFMIPEQATAFALYENDQLDFIDNRSFSTPDVQRYKNSSEYHNFALLRGNYLGFNVKKAPFNDVRVRQAFSHAIDRARFPKILRRGEKPMTSWIPPGILGYSPASATSYDPQLARHLLTQAGYADGKNFPRVQLLYPNREDTRLVVEAVQDQLKDNLNVKVDLLNQEWQVYLSTLHRDPPPLFRASWGADYPDPETFMNLFTSHNGNNSTCWGNAAYDALVDKASAEQNRQLRGALYAEADAMLCQKEVPISPIFLSTQNIMVKPWVHGIEMNALDLQFFQSVKVGD